jgi:hypothetical protein
MSDAIPEATAPSRSCGSCTMCCKVYDVPPIDNKPRGIWCQHCKPGKGCGIWETRPQFCRDFVCTWILDPLLGDEWRPDRSKLVLNHLPTHNVLVVMVDPGTPDAWRKEPYHSALRRIAGKFAEMRHAVEIVINHDTTVITPTREFHIGSKADEVEFKWAKRKTPEGETHELIDVIVKTQRVA